MSDLTIQKLQDLCCTVRAVFGEQAIISGGAPRDVLSGVAVKDIDIFVKLDETQLGKADSDFVKQCQTLASWIGGEAEMRLSNESYINCFDLCDITKDGIKGALQVIGISGDPADDVPKYDFDLSQVFITPHGLFATEAAWLARQARTITFTPSAGDEKAMLRSKARLERLRAKYVGWTFKNTEALDALMTPADLDELLAGMPPERSVAIEVAL